MILVVGDRPDVLRFRCKRGGGPFDLSAEGYSAELRCRQPDASEWSKSGTISDGDGGIVEVTGFASTDFDQIGAHHLELVITQTGSLPIHSEERFVITVREEYEEAP